MKRIKCCKQPVTNSSRTRGRELLSAHDRTEPGKSGLTSTQGKGPGFVGNRLEARICDDQLRESQVQIGFGAKKIGHAFLGIMWLASMEVADAEIRATHSTNATRFPLCALAERLSAPRSRTVGSTQCRHGESEGWATYSAHRGYRPSSLPARIRSGDLRRSRVDRSRVGKPG